MKRTATILLALLLTLAVSAKGPSSWGVKAGTGVMYQTNTLTQTGVTMLPFVGAYAGAFACMEPSSTGIGLRGELLLSTEGSHLKLSDIDDVSKDAFSYLRCVMLASYTILDGKFHLLAGPQAGLCLDVRSISLWNDNRNGARWPKDSYSLVDFGFAFGVSYDLWKSLSVEARYCLGLTSALPEADNDYCNRGGQFGIAWKF